MNMSTFMNTEGRSNKPQRNLSYNMILYLRGKRRGRGVVFVLLWSLGLLVFLCLHVHPLSWVNMVILLVL